MNENNTRRIIHRFLEERAQIFLAQWPRHIPIGRCWCGCGGKTRVAKNTDSQRHRVQDFPTPYIFGHQTKGKPSIKRGVEVIHPGIHPFKFLDGSPKYVVDEATGCWNWVGGIDSGGYGKTTYAHKQTDRAHVVSWELHNKQKVPEGQEIDHLCRNRRCCNPNHLEAKTHIENVRRGKNVKLTLSDVDFIRYLYLSGQKKMVDLGEAYRVNPATISRIVSKQTWNEPCPLSDGLKKLTNGERGARRVRNTNNTTGYKGVQQCKNRGRLVDRWFYLIQTSKLHERGLRCETPEEAAHGWDKRMLELFGSVAVLNFPVKA